MVNKGFTLFKETTIFRKSSLLSTVTNSLSSLSMEIDMKKFIGWGQAIVETRLLLFLYQWRSSSTYGEHQKCKKGRCTILLKYEIYSSFSLNFIKQLKQVVMIAFQISHSIFNKKCVVPRTDFSYSHQFMSYLARLLPCSWRFFCFQKIRVIRFEKHISYKIIFVSPQHELERA